MTQTLYACMNKRNKKKKITRRKIPAIQKIFYGQMNIIYSSIIPLSLSSLDNNVCP
jgi:hypothetical protein